jgi:hypothetical protein
MTKVCNFLILFLSSKFKVNCANKLIRVWFSVVNLYLVNAKASLEKEAL